MSATPDRAPGQREEEDGLLLVPGAVTPSNNGEIFYVTGTGFQFREEGVTKTLTGTGISEAQHKALRNLIHFINSGPADGFASGAYRETLPSADPFPTSVIWWTSVVKTAKIVERLLTYNVNKTILTDQWKVYATDGTTVLATATDTPSYSGIFETSRVRVIT